MTLKIDAKFEEKMVCGLQKLYKLGKLSPEHLKVSKLGL